MAGPEGGNCQSACRRRGDPPPGACGGCWCGGARPSEALRWGGAEGASGMPGNPPTGRSSPSDARRRAAGLRSTAAGSGLGIPPDARAAVGDAWGAGGGTAAEAGPSPGARARPWSALGDATGAGPGGYTANGCWSGGGAAAGAAATAAAEPWRPGSGPGPAPAAGPPGGA